MGVCYAKKILQIHVILSDDLKETLMTQIKGIRISQSIKIVIDNLTRRKKFGSQQDWNHSMSILSLIGQELSLQNLNFLYNDPVQ